MARVEIRRHAERQDRSDNSSHLARAGVEMARRVGGSTGPFNYVVTSSLPRAIETAIAMGFAVDKASAAWQELDMTAPPEDGWAAGFAAWAEAYRKRKQTRVYADRLASEVRSIMARLPEDGSALVVTHGGIVEACAVALAPDADHRVWGGYAGYCEGVAVEFERGKVIAAAVLRVN